MSFLYWVFEDKYCFSLPHNSGIALLAAAAFTLLTTTSYAGAYDADTEICKGTVNVGSQWTTVIDETGSYNPCRFSTTSKLGHRILTVCPNRSRCIIDASTTGHLALRTIKAVTFVKQAVKVCGRMLVVRQDKGSLWLLGRWQSYRVDDFDKLECSR